MYAIDRYKFEADKGVSIHNFAESLIHQYNRFNNDIIGIFNGIELRVNQYENPMSLYWQYMYKKEVKSK